MAHRAKRAWPAAFLILVIGCGGKSENDSGSTGGVAGSAGSGASGGSAGTSGSGSAAGSGGTAGSGGSAGVGGSAGTGPGPACSDDTQCKLFSDCCTCMALGANDPEPPACLATCKQDMCSGMGVTSGKASCTVGQCIVGYDCDASQVFCNALPPLCEKGLLPSVIGGCWGPCVPATECASVPACTECAGPLTTCVTLDTQGSESATHHCVDVPQACAGNPTCACLGSSVCPIPYSACTDLSGVPGVLCSCPNC